MINHESNDDFKSYIIIRGSQERLVVLLNKHSSQGHGPAIQQLDFNGDAGDEGDNSL
jgi:hypothetical protein